MIWSFLKIFVFLVMVLALTTGASYLMQAQGGVQITAMGQEITLAPLQSVIAASALVVVLYVFFKLAGLLVATLRFLNGDETAVSRYFDRNRDRKGARALSEALMALASGEGRLAIAKAEKARKYLQTPDLTDLLIAQAAELSGDGARAEKVYRKLVQKDDTRFVGIRGLMKQKLAAGDTEVALKLAEKAFALRPKHEEVQDVLLQLQTDTSDWKGARATLAAKLRSGALPRDVHKRRDAVLALSEARDVLDTGKSIEAREAAIAASKKSPDLVPATAMAARGYIAENRPRNAVRLLRKAWEIEPHPDLAAAFADIEPEETPTARLRRFQTLTNLRKDHPETRMLLAELNLAAEDFPAARRALGDLVEQQADARVLTIMAAIERGEGADEAIVRAWLTKALVAPRGPQWVCDACNNIHADWAPTCDNCHGLDTLSWKTPPQSATSLPGGAEMLPLLVGQPATTSEPPSANAVAEVSTTTVTPEVEDAELADETSENGPKTTIGTASGKTAA
ncbi:MAG: heme biosynthesis protein HemY [Primorskyibacter sp.]